MNRQQMNAPFAEEELRQFKGRGGKTMTFIEDETVMDRLDVGYGPGNWQVQVDAVPGPEHVVKVRLGVRENGEWIWNEDFGYPTQADGESLKEAVSDGIRRCGRYVGIARDLYRKATYEPGGLLGAARPVADDIPPTDPADETLRPLGPIERVGAIAKGTGRHSDMEWRRTPDDGYRFGFLLEVGDGKAKPQVVVEGPAAFGLFAVSNGQDLVGEQVTVKGDLFEVHVPKRKTIYRIVATWLQTKDWTIPAEGPEDDGPSPDAVEAESAPLFTEGEWAGV